MNTDLTGATSTESQPISGWLKGLVAPMLSLLFAITGQWLFTQDTPNYPAGGFSYVIGLILFMIIIVGWPPASLLPPQESPIFQQFQLVTKKVASRLFLLLGVVLLSMLAFFGFSGNSLMGGIWAWLGAVLLFLIAFAEKPVGSWGTTIQTLFSWWKNIDKRVFGILAGIVLIGVFFRVYRLPTIPAEMTSDHAEKLLDVQDILDGQRPIFLPRNTGREGIQFYLTALLINFTPLETNHLALKVGTAVVGIVTIPFVFLVGKLFFGRLTGFTTAFLFAVSHWHVAITRVGLRFPFTAAFATPALYFLFRAFKANRRNDWLAAALFLGVGLHTYTALRIVPLLFILLIGLRLILDGWQILRKRPLASFNSWSKAFFSNFLLSGFFTILLFLPLARVIIDDPAAFWLRMASRTQADQSAAVGELVSVFIDNTRNALLMFNIKGDVVVVNTIPGSPVLGVVTAALFLMGIFYLIWRLLSTGDRRSIYILTTAFILMLPSILSLAYPQENPSVVRTGGAIPWIILIASLPLTIVIMRINDLPNFAGKLAGGLGIAVLASAIILYNYNWYFNRYDAIIRYSLWNSSEMGMVMRDFIESGGNPADVYHIPYPHWVDTRNIGINAGYIRWANAWDEEAWSKDYLQANEPKLFFLFPDDTRSLEKLMILFPHGQTEVYDSHWEGKDFIIYRVP